MFNLIKTIASPLAINKNRIAWIDIAKGIAILLVIIGHCPQIGSPLISIIFSFHMPLFFILSGYTFRAARSKDELLLHLKKNIKHLYFPVIIILIFWMFISLYQIGRIDLSIIKLLLRDGISMIYWGLGDDYNGHLRIGIPWFLISLFWSKLIIDVLSVYFKKQDVFYLIIFIAILGLYLSVNKIILIQGMTTNFISVFFIYIGMLWKQFEPQISKYSQLIFIVCLPLWLYPALNIQFINMAAWSYPQNILTIIESMAGSFSVCCICKSISEKKILSYPFMALGAQTMIIFSVHALDYLFREIWNTETVYQTVLNRIVFVLIISFVFLELKYLTNLLINKIKNKPVF